MTDSNEQPICPDCGQPMLKPGQKRENRNDYRHARGCPIASPQEKRATEKFWAEFEQRKKNR